MLVKCGKKEADFFPLKCKKSGKSIAKCIKHNGQWMNPPEFESLAGMHGKRWRMNIKFEGKPLGQWLAEHDSDPSSQKPQNTERVQTTTELQGVNDLLSLDNSVNSASVTSPGNILSALETSATVGDVDMTTPHNEQECISQFPRNYDISQLCNDIELKLSTSIKEIVEETMSTLKRSMLAEIQSLRKTITSLTSRVKYLEETLHSYSCPVQTDVDNVSQLATNASPDQQQTSSSSVSQQQLLYLQSQIQSLTTQQSRMAIEKEREKRRCNILLGNVQEDAAESTTTTATMERVITVFRERMGVDCTPVHVTRIGKQQAGRERLILVKLNSFGEKLQLLKKARSLSGSQIYLMEDLSKRDREKRAMLVTAMKRARNEGKRAFIRFSDGELIVDGKIHAMSEKSIDENSAQSSTPQRPAVQATSNSA